MATDHDAWLHQRSQQSRLVSDADVSIEYLAGFFDGEGCFSTTITETGKVPQFIMKTTTTKESEPTMFKDQFGGSVSHHVPNNENHSPWWTWIVSGTAAKLASESLRPHLIGKREQCELFVEAMKYRSRSRVGHGRYSPRSKERLREYGKRIRSMNSAQRRYSGEGDN